MLFTNHVSKIHISFGLWNRINYFLILFCIIYDLRPLDGGCIMYYGEDERISIFDNRLIKFVGHQGEYNIGDSIKIVKVK